VFEVCLRASFEKHVHNICELPTVPSGPEHISLRAGNWGVSSEEETNGDGGEGTGLEEAKGKRRKWSRIRKGTND
jgi:hypothetical protein